MELGSSSHFEGQTPRLKPRGGFLYPPGACCYVPNQMRQGRVCVSATLALEAAVHISVQAGASLLVLRRIPSAKGSCRRFCSTAGRAQN